MQVTNGGRGVHVREVKGIERLKSLPKDWYAFTNLELATGIGRSRELDVIMVTDHMIFLVDLKDWSGAIESDSGDWLHNGRDTGPSPVAKIHSNVKDVLRLLTTQLRSRPESKSLPIPKIVGVVVITGKANLSGIAATERSSVFEIDDFLKMLGSEKARRAAFGTVVPQIVADALTSAAWKNRLVKFFNVKAGPFKPGRSRYDRYVATSDQATLTISTGNMRPKKRTRCKISGRCGSGISRTARTVGFRLKKGVRRLQDERAKSFIISATGTKVARTGFWFRRRPTPIRASAIGRSTTAGGA